MKTRQRSLPPLFVGLAILLVACQAPPPTISYEGTSTVGGLEQPLTLAVTRHGDRLVGEYRVRAAVGKLAGTLNGADLTATLTPAPDCSYEFLGAFSLDAITGAFEPTDCAGGASGTWALERR